MIGAHYDSVGDSPGANDNASGVAVMLELARRHARSAAPLTVRFVAFVNEEPPHFMTAAMGSYRYAVSQRYPFPFGLVLPSRVYCERSRW